MKIGKWAGLLLVTVPLMSGCKDFWQSSNGSFTLTNSGNITVSPGATTGNSSTITVTPTDSFTGTVALTCTVSTTPSSATDPTTCDLSSSSLTISSTTAVTSTLTATTESTTTTGAYDITVTGTSGSISKTTTVCVEVTSGSCSSSAGSSGKFYILNDGTTPEIVGKSIQSGTLSGISGSPWSLSSLSIDGTPYSMAIAPNGDFLLLNTSSGVYTCLLTSGIPGKGVLVSTDAAYAIQIDQIDSSDSWLIEAIPEGSSVMLNAVPINSTTGKYTSGGTTHSVTISNLPNVAVQPNRMVLSPGSSDIKVFVPLGRGGTLVVPFDASSPFPNGVSHIAIPVANGSNYGSALSVAVDPTNRLFYIGETEVFPTGTTTGGLRAFTYASSSSSSPTDISSSPIASGGTAPNFILPDASGNYVYVANGNGTSNAGNVTGFAITKSSSKYTIATDSTVAAGAQPMGLAEDSTDAYIFAVSEDQSPFLDAYTFDSTTGELSSQATSDDIQTGSIAVVAAP